MSEDLELLRLKLKIQENELKLRATMVQVDSLPPPSKRRSARAAVSEYGAWAGPIALVTAILGVVKPTVDPQKLEAAVSNVSILKESADDSAALNREWHTYLAAKANAEACRWRQAGSALERDGYIISVPRDSVEWKSERLETSRSAKSPPLWSTVNDCPLMPDPPTRK